MCKHFKVECEGFATVVMETEHGTAQTLFGNGNSIKTEANGECFVEKSDGSKLCFDIKGKQDPLMKVSTSDMLFQVKLAPTLKTSS